MEGIRKSYLPAFKVKVALEAIREEKTVVELARVDMEFILFR